MAAELVSPPRTHLKALGISRTTKSTPAVWVLCEVELVNGSKVEVNVLMLEGGKY